MKYQVNYKDSKGIAQQDIKDFNSTEDFEKWEAEQKSMGVDVTEITNIHEKVMFKSELDDDEFRMLVKNLSRPYKSHVIARSVGDIMVQVTDDIGGGFKVDQKNNILTIHSGVYDHYTPSYFTRAQVLMFMEMFKTKFQFAS